MASAGLCMVSNISAGELLILSVYPHAPLTAIVASTWQYRASNGGMNELLLLEKVQYAGPNYCSSSERTVVIYN